MSDVLLLRALELLLSAAPLRLDASANEVSFAEPKAAVDLVIKPVSTCDQLAKTLRRKLVSHLDSYDALHLPEGGVRVLPLSQKLSRSTGRDSGAGFGCSFAGTRRTRATNTSQNDKTPCV